jgi:hypothetical protein
VQAWRAEVLRSVKLADCMDIGCVHAALVTYTQAHSLSHTRRLSLCVQKVQLADSSDSALKPCKAPAAGSGSALGADTLTSSKSLFSVHHKTSVLFILENLCSCLCAMSDGCVNRHCAFRAAGNTSRRDHCGVRPTREAANDVKLRHLHARYLHKLVSLDFRGKWCADLILMSVSILVLLVHLAASICSQVHSAMVEALQCSCNAPNSLRTQRREGVLIA